MKGSPLRITVIIILVIVLLFIGLVALNNNKSTSDNTNFSNGPSVEGQPTVGDEDAPVTIVEFGDFKCPSCKEWSENYFPQLEKDYIDTGDATFSFINVLFHGDESELASLAAETIYKQNPEAYWDFHQALFQAQPENQNLEWVTPEKILEIADSVSGIDTDKLETALDEESEIDEVEKDTDLVKEFGVDMTPSIIINGKMVEDPFDYEEIKQTIEDAQEND